MNSDRLKSASEQAVNKAISRGADGCDALASQGKSFSLSAQRGELDKLKVSSSQVIGLRVIKNQKVGIAYSEALDDGAIDQMVNQALELSKFSGEDPYQVIDYQSTGDYIESKPEIYQEDQTPLADKIDFSLKLESGVLAQDKRVKNSPYNGYADGEMVSSYLNHLGTYCSQKERSFSCYTSVLAEEGGRQAMYAESSVARTFQELDADQCIKEVMKYALPLINGKAVSTGKYDVVFSPDQLDQLFSCFTSCFSGDSAKEGKSRFKDQVGETIASSLLTIRDCPQYRDGFYYSAFDDEGMMRKELLLLDQGVLRSLYHNSATARFFGTQSTAHASRSAKGSLGVSGTQIVIDPGKTPEEELSKGEYLEVFGLKGLHSGTNPISGQFSLAIEGILHRDGDIVQYVRDVTISGNFFKLLESISLVGDRLHHNSSRTFFAPKIRFNELSIAG